MTRNRDDFEGIDISGPWGGVRIGSGGSRFSPELEDDDMEEWEARRRVRRRLDFYKNFVTFALVVGGLTVIDAMTGDRWWVQWVAIIWGAFLAMQFTGTFVAPALWGREAEDRMVRREIERNRGRVHVTPPPPPPDIP